MLTDPAFIHLRLHSEYSIVDSIVRIDEVLSKAASDNMPAVALTDLANLFGLIKFYQSAYKKGIKPIIGCDSWIRMRQIVIGLPAFYYYANLLLVTCYCVVCYHELIVKIYTVAGLNSANPGFMLMKVEQMD